MTLNYRVEGEGRPLLMVHGFMISFNIWRNLASLLQPHFKLVMVELPGIGQSPLPSDGEDTMATAIEGIEEVRETLGLERWAVLGYSSGSRVAEAYVQQHAAHVSRAVFLCPLVVERHKALALGLALQVDQWFPAFGDWALSGSRLMYLVSLLGFNRQPDPLAKEWYSEISSRPMRLRKETIRASGEVAQRPFFVPVPYAMIWGDRDLVPATPRRPGPRDHFVHGQHAAPMVSAEEVAALVVALLKDST